MEKEQQAKACSQPLEGLAVVPKHGSKVSGGAGERGRQHGWEPPGEHEASRQEEVGQGGQA